eukprot:1378263-Amphidinium_carterae.1
MSGVIGRLAVTNMSMKNVDSAQSDVDQPDPEGCQLDPEVALSLYPQVAVAIYQLGWGLSRVHPPHDCETKRKK